MIQDNKIISLVRASSNLPAISSSTTKDELREKKRHGLRAESNFDGLAIPICIEGEQSAALIGSKIMVEYIFCSLLIVLLLADSSG